MSLLSRSRGSKGYGACRDAASPRADQPKGDGARVFQKRAALRLSFEFYWSYTPVPIIRLAFASKCDGAIVTLPPAGTFVAVAV